MQIGTYMQERPDFRHEHSMPQRLGWHGKLPQVAAALLVAGVLWQ